MPTMTLHDADTPSWPGLTQPASRSHKSPIKVGLISRLSSVAVSTLPISPKFVWHPSSRFGRRVLIKNKPFQKKEQRKAKSEYFLTKE